VIETLDHTMWQLAMTTDMQALEHNKTRELVPPFFGKKTIGCCWVYAIKVGPNGEVDRFKA